MDVLTVEIEHIDADALDSVASELGLDVEPTPSTLRLIQVLHLPNRHICSSSQPSLAYMICACTKLSIARLTLARNYWLIIALVL